MHETVQLRVRVRELAGSLDIHDPRFVQHPLKEDLERLISVEHRRQGIGLVDAVARSWEDRNYVNVVRDAFVYLEQALRGAGKVPSTDSVSAVPLINRLAQPWKR